MFRKDPNLQNPKFFEKPERNNHNGVLKTPENRFLYTKHASCDTFPIETCLF